MVNKVLSLHCKLIDAPIILSYEAVWHNGSAIGCGHNHEYCMIVHSRQAWLGSTQSLHMRAGSPYNIMYFLLTAAKLGVVKECVDYLVL